jgi:hypothetical protein
LNPEKVFLVHIGQESEPLLLRFEGFASQTWPTERFQVRILLLEILILVGFYLNACVVRLGFKVFNSFNLFNNLLPKQIGHLP